MAEVYEYRPNGTRWEYTKKHERVKWRPYDYNRQGLLNKLLSPTVYNAENTTTRAVLKFVEDVCIELLKYVDMLKQFKNWNWRQY